MNIEILGPRGSGKTTIANNLSETYGIPYISLGQIAREEMRIQSPIGKQMQYHIENKIPYPEGFLVDIISTNLENSQKYGGFILDGYPRRATEARELITILGNIQAKIDVIINLKLELADIKKRVENRYICPHCGLQVESGVGADCPKCRGKLVKRTDDNEASLQEAYDLHHRESTAIISILTAENALTVFDIDCRPVPSIITAGLIFNIDQLANGS